MKKILVPTDFSSNAYAALIYVSKLYKADDVEITLLHSFEDEVSRLTTRIDQERATNIVEKLRAQSEEDGAALLAEIIADGLGHNHKFTMVSTPSNLTKTVNKMVAEDAFNLVVMGSKGRTGAEEMLMGSTTILMTKNLESCPLLIVPREIAFVLPSNIVFATDYMEFFQLSRLKPITQLVRHYRSIIHLVYVGSENEMTEVQLNNLEKFRLDLSEYDTEFHFIPKKDSVSKTIHHFLDEKSMDFLSLVYHKHTFIKQLFREPVVNRVGKHSSIPTLVIPVE